MYNRQRLGLGMKIFNIYISTTYSIYCLHPFSIMYMSVHYFIKSLTKMVFSTSICLNQAVVFHA